MKKSNKFSTFILILLFVTFKTKAQTDVHFMTFNVWQESTSVSNGLVKIRDVIVKANPDIIGFSEVWNYNSDRDYLSRRSNPTNPAPRYFY
jgi:hypothetical protein